MSSGPLHNRLKAAALLEVSPQADAVVLRAAFRRKALMVHPDRPGGSAKAFQAAVDAFQLLSQPLPKSDLFFAPARTDATAARPARSTLVLITPAQACLGGQVRAHLPDDRRITLTLPAGLRSGDRIRAAGHVLTIAIQSNRDQRVLGHDVWVEAGLSRRQMLVGGKVSLATPAGPRTVILEPGSDRRRVIRLKSGGLPARAGHPEGRLILIVSCTDVNSAPAPSRDLRQRFARSWAA